VPLADQIRTRRTERGLSLAELARQARVSKGYLHELETKTDGPRPSADVLYRLAFALGASVGELLEKDIPRVAELTDVPEALRAFALRAGLSEADLRMLAAIRFRGHQPRTARDWEYLYESIRRSIPEGEDAGA
jgi:transcriptional regulator with XRE-family HTH domain